MEKLSSGERINRASDDPAGLVLSERMRAQIGSIAKEITNLDLVLAKNKTADSHLMQMEDQLINMREVAVAASSTGYADESMIKAYESVMNDTVRSVNRIADEASFGNTGLFDGSEGSVADIDELSEFDLSDPEQAQQAVERIDDKLSELHSVHGELGAKSAYEVQSMRRNLAVTHQNLTESESMIRDADMAKLQTDLVAQKLKVNIGTALLAQGNLMSKSVLGLVQG
jgi:flagellin